MKEYEIKLMNGKNLKTRLNDNERYLENTYKKAKVKEENGAKELYSYETKVARITKNGEFIRKWDGYSNTTLKHVNIFRLENGMKTINKKEWMEIPVNKSHKQRWVYVVTIKNKKEIYEESQILSAVNKISKRIEYRSILEWAKYVEKYNEETYWETVKGTIEHKKI